MLSKTIGTKLFELRKQKNWSQEQTADYLKISRSAYQRIETGEGFSWASNLENICQVFEIQPEELFKQETLVINHNQKGGGGYIQIVNELSDKLIEQFEIRLKDKDETITLLNNQIKNQNIKK
jgi:transcriptional regulator with XRE-family HTH domain